jgi:hypothetical protein
MVGGFRQCISGVNSRTTWKEGKSHTLNYIENSQTIGITTTAMLLRHLRQALRKCKVPDLCCTMFTGYNAHKPSKRQVVPRIFQPKFEYRILKNFNTTK